MSDFDVKEKRFEEDIEDYLTHHGGYTKGDPKKFNRESGLEEDTFVEFIKTSQPKKWERYVKIYAENSEKQIIERFKREVKTTNLLNVMRHGFMDRGIKFYPIFWKPETSLNETTQMQYDANILHCTRQLHYSVHNENSIDIVLFANGIPVVSMELKCQFTGQDTTNAINQYKFDRAGKDAIFAFKERVLVHFAVDLTNVYMTTRLEGAHTYFLPFNQGSNGAGKVGGKGNPVNPNGYDTAYLWERVLCKDSLMEILQKYMHLQQEYDKNGNLVKETMIFPRYHQLDVVTKLLEDVKKNGSGKSYLIQHSAGSGKSNSIAWLAHRLTGLHDYEDNKIFQSVIIVTDRRVLDSQLQSTVYQFDHVEGVVKKVDKNSGQLRDAINDGVGIIITTLQKFPVIYKEVDSAKKRFAIIIDEAHSSQTGDAAKKLKRALADTEEILKEYAEMEDEDERNRKDDEDKLLDELAAQGMHKNLSFFAFTATPKGKTLQLFGQKDAEGIYRPFHIYSMRQAIEEHFILDVLQNYMTYKMYYKIAKIIEDNPEFDTTAGSKAIINYETLHPHNISQKTAIMLEHFMNVTRHKIGGRAKAMVVTPSRLHAVRYVQEFKRQIKEKGLNDLEVLVAFSGEVKDNDDVFTEEGMNKDKEGKTIKEKALPETFHADDYGILVVAEKYQTGFDEPLLHTMFVDKKLSGVKAVQTLSRLNRTTRGKVDTFVLDFVNSAEDIKASFEPFYEETVLLEETDPNVVYDMKNTLDDFRVYQKSEVDKFADIFYQNENQSAGDLGKLQGQLRPAIDRYEVLEVEKQDIFKSKIKEQIEKYYIKHPDEFGSEREQCLLWLNRNKINKYDELPKTNARLEALKEKAFTGGAEKYLWIPPSLPYYEMQGAYKNSKGFSKILVFSAWEMVPRMIGALVSYEAERLTVGKLVHQIKNQDKKNTGYFADGSRRYPVARLRFNVSNGEVRGMSLFALLYPSKTLSDMYLPIESLNNHESLEVIEKSVRLKLKEKLAIIEEKYGDSGNNKEDARWYYLAPMLMDGVIYAKHWIEDIVWEMNTDEEDTTSEVRSSSKDKRNKGFIAHIDKLRSYLDAPEEIHLGRKPEDLLETLVNMVLGSPAICIYRSNGRSTARATSLAKVFVNNFNLPESTAIIDLAYGRCRDDNSHWQNVLKYCKDGCFQAMIDEYIHMLKETAGFQSDGNQYQIVHDMMMDSLKIHTATYIADTYPDFKKRINGADRKSDGCRIRSSYAVGFTKDAGDNSKVVMRKENIRNAFNSPMRPFVLATTSIGQEGLDFHNYCRVIMHWNLPSNPIDVGRILRTFKIKKNVEVTDNGKIII